MILPLSIDIGMWIIIEKDQIEQVIDVFKAHGILSRTHQNSILLIVESLCFVFALSLKTCWWRCRKRAEWVFYIIRVNNQKKGRQRLIDQSGYLPSCRDAEVNFLTMIYNHPGTIHLKKKSFIRVADLIWKNDRWGIAWCKILDTVLYAII